MKKLLFALLLFSVPAFGQITQKVQHSFSATTTWASKDFATVTGQTKKIKGYILSNDSSTLSDTVWVGHQYQSTVIDTASTYRTPVLGGESFAISGVLLDDIWVKSASGTVAVRLVIY